MEGGKQVEAQIEGIGDGLHDLDVRDARAAKQALDQIDKTSFKNLRSQVSSLSKQMDEWGNQLQKLGDGITNVGQKLTIGLTAPIAGLAVAAVKSFADVESAVANISTIKPEIDTSQVMTALNEMSTRIPQTAQQLGDGLYNIFSSINVTQAEGLKLVEQFGRGATAAQTDAQTFGTAVLGVMNAYKMSVQDAGHISDVFFNTVNLGVVNGQELAGSLGEVTQSAKNAGVGLDELGALIVGVTKEGGSASQNINNLANFLQKLPTKESSKAIKALGVDVQDAKGKFRPVIDVLGDLKGKLDAMTPSARALALQKIFPDAQARTGAQTLLSQLDAVKEALEVNKTTAGAADAAYQKIAGTATVQFSLLKNSAIAILAELGSAILPLLQPLMIWIAQTLVPAVKGAVESFKQWSPEMKTVAIAIGAVAAAIGPVLVVIGTVITAIGGFIGAISTIGSGIAALSGLSAIAPIVGTVALMIAGLAVVIGAVAAHAYVLYKAWQTNFGGLRDFTNEVWTAIKQYIGVALAEIENLVNEIGGDIVAWWQENYPLIQQTIANVSNKIQFIIQNFLAALREFWDIHGEQITTIVRSTWNIISNVVRTFVGVILQTIKLVMQVINGDWSGAWQTAKDIVSRIVVSMGVILKNLNSIIIAGMKFIVTAIVNTGIDIYNKAVAIGKNLGEGMVAGMTSLRDRVISTAKDLITDPLSIFRSVPKIQSPSKVTTEIGEYIGEGLAVGMENKIDRVKGAAKKLANETIKQLKDAVKEFDKLAGASPDTVKTIQTANRIQDATQMQQEIIKLRAELGVNNYNPLPTGIGDTEQELNRLKQMKQANEDLAKSYDDLRDMGKEIEELRDRELEQFEQKKDAIRNSGAAEMINLQEQIDLTGVADEKERDRIKNYYDMERLRQQMTADGYGEAQIQEAEDILRVEQARQLELKRILEIRKEAAEAADLEKDLGQRLAELQSGNRELTEYEKTLRKINEDLKDLTPEQKQHLLDIAQQIDQQKRFNEQYQKTYDLIRSALDVLTDSGKSFGEKLKTIFGGILDSFKKMLLDMTAQWLTSKIFKMLGSNVSSGSGFGSILQRLFGGGGLFGGNSGGGIFSFGGGGGAGGFGGLGNVPGLSVPAPVHSGQANAGGGGGIGLGGGLVLAGMAANVVGSLIGGRAGTFISNIGGGVASGASIGMMFGGPLGAGIGAAIGGAVGLLQSIFGGDPKRKADKKENLPKLQQGFAEAFKALQELGADKNALFSDPAGTLQKAKDLREQIRNGFGIQMLSKKYQKIAQQQIAQKLIEADAIVAEIERAADSARTAIDADTRLETSFAGGVYMDAAFRRQFGAFKRRNGMLAGGWTGRDVLPSMLAMGEMVLNPMQIARVKAAAGFDVFKGAGVPGYAGGTFVSPSASTPSVSVPVAKQPIIVQLYLTNSGMVESDIKNVLIDSLGDSDVQVEVVRTYDKGKSRNIS